MSETRAERLARLLASDLEVRGATPSREDFAFISKCGSAIELVAAAFKRYADRPCFGFREADLTGSERASPRRFRTLAYQEVWARVTALASGWSHRALVRPGDFVGVLGAGG